MTDVTTTLVALKEVLINLSASLEDEKQQHKNLLIELNNYLQNSQQNIETNINDFLKNIEFSNLINATNQAQNNIIQQEQVIAFLSQKIESLGNLVDESILKIGEQHNKMLNDIKENSDEVRSEIVETIAKDFRKDVISSFLVEIEESIGDLTDSVKSANNNALEEIIETYKYLNTQVKKVKDNHSISLVDFQNHVATFNKTMNESIASVAAAFSAVKQQCVNFTKKLFEENKVLLNEVVKHIAAEAKTVTTEVDRFSIAILDNFKKNIVASQKYFDEEVVKLNSAIALSSKNTLTLMQQTHTNFQIESNNLISLQQKHSNSINLNSEKIIEAQELVCQKIREKLNFKFYTSNAILILTITLIALITLNIFGTYRYAELNSYNIALMNEASNLKQENNRLYSIRKGAEDLANGSLAQLRKKFPQLVINCTTAPQ